MCRMSTLHMPAEAIFPAGTKLAPPAPRAASRLLTCVGHQVVGHVALVSCPVAARGAHKLIPLSPDQIIYRTNKEKLPSEELCTAHL